MDMTHLCVQDFAGVSGSTGYGLCKLRRASTISGTVAKTRNANGQQSEEQKTSDRTLQSKASWRTHRHFSSSPPPDGHLLFVEAQRPARRRVVAAMLLVTPGMRIMHDMSSAGCCPPQQIDAALPWSTATAVFRVVMLAMQLRRPAACCAGHTRTWAHCTCCHDSIAAEAPSKSIRRKDANFIHACLCTASKLCRQQQMLLACCSGGSPTHLT